MANRTGSEREEGLRLMDEARREMESIDFKMEANTARQSKLMGEWEKLSVAYQEAQKRWWKAYEQATGNKKPARKTDGVEK